MGEFSTDTNTGPISSIAIIANSAISLTNFRGPLIRQLIRQRVHVFALAPDYDDTTRHTVRQLGAEPIEISLERAGMNVLRDIRDAVRLSRVMTKLKPDAVFCYFIKPVIYGTIAAKIAGVPRRYALVAGLGYVYTPTASREVFRQMLLQAITSCLYRIAFGFCTQVFVQNPDDFDFFESKGIADPHKMTCLAGTGVDLDEWAPAPPVTKPPTFLLMARLLRAKGIVEYVEAARIVRRLHPDARFLLLGGLDPSPDGLTSDEVTAWHAEGAIEWIGHVSDVRPWIARSSVYVLPSYREGKPRSTQEAMAMARPIVTTDVPGCRDTVVPGVNGFLVPQRAPEPLAQALKRFIEEPDLIRQMGAESRRLVEERFDAKAINAVILGKMGILPETASHEEAPAPGVSAVMRRRY